MVIKEGYKQTEIGVIPMDWEVKQLHEIVKPERLISYGIVQTGKHIPNGIKCVRVVDIIDGNIDADKMITTSIEISNSYKRTILQKDDLIIALRGKIGEVAITEDVLIGSNLTRGVALISLKEIHNPKFIQQQLKSSKSKSILESNLNGSALKELSISVLRKIPISLPTTKAEQTAIATALSDADGFITGLEKLIAKKRNIKQGAMQQLLQPKEGWEVKKLGELLGKVTTGKLDANAMNENGEFRFYTCAKDYCFIDNYAFDSEALLVSGNGANVGYIHYYKGKFNAYQRTYVLTDFKIDIFYIKLYLDSYLKDRITTEVSAGNTPYIKMDTITDMIIHYPKNSAEQTRIATILSDMDAELSAIEQKLEKYKKIKLGMMQELLTGKTRLV
jgi:type I restriction enzyme S subunit